MLLSLEKNFIFIHVPKTAGSSFTDALKPWCVQPPRTQFRRLLSHLPVRERPGRAYLRQHDKAAWVRHKLGRDFYEFKFKFATVRNPYDFALSYFHFLRKNRKARRFGQAQSWDFHTFLRYMEKKSRYVAVDQTSWLVDGSGKLIVDNLLRYELIDDDFRRVVTDLGLGQDVVLPKPQKIGASKRHEYDETAQAMVERIFARDFERLGYATTL